MVEKPCVLRLGETTRVRLVLPAASPAEAKPEEPVGLGRVAGVVVGQDGRPLAGAKVTLEPNVDWDEVSEEIADRLRRLRPVVTGADGRFAFDDIPPAPRGDLIVKAPGYGSTDLRFASLDRPAHDLVIRVEPSAVFTVEVEPPSGWTAERLRARLQARLYVTTGHRSWSGNEPALSVTEEEGCRRASPRGAPSIMDLQLWICDEDPSP